MKVVGFNSPENKPLLGNVFSLVSYPFGVRKSSKKNSKFSPKKREHLFPIHVNDDPSQTEKLISIDESVHKKGILEGIGA